jgi:hypothetical protein
VDSFVIVGAAFLKSGGIRLQQKRQQQQQRQI